MTKVHFWLFFGHDMSTEMGVVMYMYSNHPLDYIDSKYIWVHGSNSIGSSILFADIPYLAILVYHRKRMKCGQVGPSPCYSQSELYRHTKF